MKLKAAYIALALRLQESVGDITGEDSRARLVTALMDEKAIPLGEAGARNSKSDLQILQTIHDHAVSLGAACSEPDGDETGELSERFISKDARDAMDSSDFAGKGKSFPIKNQTDVEAAMHSIGRAGADNYSHDEIKANIIRIAKRKGLKVPGSDAKESQTPESAGSLKLSESMPFVVDIPLREAFTAGTKIKLIKPGPGSSAWYTEESLKQAAKDKIFHAGLPMRIDHPTAAEIGARPEGSVKDWGAVLAHDAEWLESYIDKTGKDLGRGLYSDIKPFSDHAQTIQEKGPYAGVSICASGDAVMEAGRQVLKDGVPLLKCFTSAEGADMVTRAGAGGMFLTEAARSAESKEGGTSMDEAAVQKLIESAVKSAQAPLLERAIRGDAREEAARVLSTMTLHEALKGLVTENVLSREIPQVNGALDTVKFTESINAEAKRIGAAHAAASGTGQVRGLGSAALAEADPVKIAEARKREEDSEAQFLKESENVFARLMGNPEAAKRAAQKGRAA